MASYADPGPLGNFINKIPKLAVSRAWVLLVGACPSLSDRKGKLGLAQPWTEAAELCEDREQPGRAVSACSQPDLQDTNSG